MPRIIALFTLLIIIFCVSLAFSQGFLPERYHTYQEVLDTLTELRDSFPEILYLDTLGYSTRDTIPMLRLKISDNPQIDEDEPAVFFDGGVHADEVLSVEVPMKFIQDIVYKYSQNDPDVIEFVNNLEIFVVPIINPEGHIVVEQGDLDWRKNKSDNDTNDVFDYHDGVDNNRNYDFGWDIDDATNSNVPESLMFKGFYPFSESENRAMRDFGWKYRPVIALDYHSPTYGRPNVAYYPWYWYSNQGGHGFGPDEDMMQSICADYTSQILAIPDDSNTVHYTARRALVRKGDFKTYYYGNFGTVAFTVEISDTTIQFPELVDSIVAAHLPGNYYLLNRALGAGITGIIRDSVTLEPIEAEVQVSQHINDDINPRLSRPDFGRYRRLLNPGTYTLIFLKDDYRTKTVYGVSVNSSGPTTTDILLSPLHPCPPAPELNFPTSGDSLDADTFTFDWNEPEYASVYLFEVSTDIGFENYTILDSNIAISGYALSTPLEVGRYYWRVKAGNNNGWGPYSEIYDFVINPASGIFYENSLPSEFKLYQNHPNPFNASTRIKFAIQVESEAVLEIFDITGALAARPFKGKYAAGEYTFNWDGSDSNGNTLAAGVYFYRLKCGDKSAIKKMVLLK
ncbi:MAG: T9SS type A sorting domain-containing protein [candidate division Zixibacteria bacterium]|nr:T9SS type A sorting domain-containing protein [candidate division Zixibacteria bacterium]